MNDFFWGSMSEKNQQLILDLALSVDEPNADFLKNESLLDNGSLMWFQSFAVEHAMISRSTLFSLGTGLGKTITACAYANRILKENPNTKVMFICLPESLEQIREDFNTYTDRRLVCVTGEASSILSLKNTIEDSEVVITSYQAFYSKRFCNLLLSYLYNDNRFSAVIADEVHEVSQESLINSILKSFIVKIKYKLFLTATPITVEPEQLITIMNLMDDNIFPEGRDFLKPYRILDPDTFEVIDYRHLDSLANSLYPHYLSWTRAELGINGNYYPELLLVEPTEEQLRASLTEVPTVIKGQKNSKQMEVLLTLCKMLKAQYKKGLIYASRHQNSKMIYDVLTSNGIKAFVLNGEEENKRVRQSVLKAFTRNEYDVLITNLTTSLNMDSDFLIFWENTNRAVQMLGRCERGFVPKDLYIYYILTEGTVELQQFYKNVYRRCKWLKESLDKDVDVFERFNKALENYYQQANRIQENLKLFD